MKAVAISALLPRRLLQQIRNVENGIGYWNACRLQRRHFALRRASIARDNRACMPHALACRGRAPGDKANHRLAHLFDILSGIFLIAATNLATHHHRIGLLIALKKTQAIGKSRSNDRIAPNAHTGGLPDPGCREQRHDLIRQRARARDKAHMPLAENAIRDDPNLAHTRRAKPWAVRPDQPHLLLLDTNHHPHHIQHRDILRNADNQPDVCISRLHNGIGSARWGYKNAARVCPRLLLRLGDRIKDRHTFHLCVAFAGSHATNQFRSGGQHVPGMKLSFAPGDTLDDHTRGLIEKNAHACSFIAATIFCAASRIFWPQVRPASASIARPSASPVPDRRTTMGMPLGNSACARMTPRATSSPRVMPPKILTRMPLTSGSCARNSIAFFSNSALAPPPKSKKLAGLPPTRATISTVVIANPAPLAITPTSPSSFT